MWRPATEPVSSHDLVGSFITQSSASPLRLESRNGAGGGGLGRLPAARQGEGDDRADKREPATTAIAGANPSRKASARAKLPAPAKTAAATATPKTPPSSRIMLCSFGG
jgi:hypothetical protein